MTSLKLSEKVTQVTEDVVKWRRHLHQHPELSFEEIQTSQFVYDTLASFGGLELSRPTRTSVMALLRGDLPGKTLALRADMDALPITEECSLEFASRSPGVMHACGHDGHTAILLGVARILSEQRSRLKGEIRLLFQHAEEVPPGGAVQLVEAGVMDGVDMIVGLHLESLIEVGTICISSGPIYAASDVFDIVISGQGGHASSPAQTVDSLAIAAQVVTNLQHLVSRNTDPSEALVVSITKILGGTTYNVIPSETELGGTVRMYNQELRQSVQEKMERIVKGITEAHGATYRFHYRRGYDPVVNDQKLAGIVKEALVECFGEERVQAQKPLTVSEDFSGYLQKAPGAFFRVGAGNATKGHVHPHHHPLFSIDEDAFPIGIQALVNVVFKVLDY